MSQNASASEDTPAVELDSVLLAKALRHMALIEEKELTQSQIQCILYIAYGVRLAQKGERLTAEHPQMWQYGPVFPRAYNRLRKEADDGSQEYDSLRNEHPDIFQYLTNCTSGLKRVAALFFGRECTILRLRLVKDCAAWRLACLPDAQKISTPGGVVFPCAFLDFACRNLLANRYGGAL